MFEKSKKGGKSATAGFLQKHRRHQRRLGKKAKKKWIATNPGIRRKKGGVEDHKKRKNEPGIIASHGSGRHRLDRPGGRGSKPTKGRPIYSLLRVRKSEQIRLRFFQQRERGIGGGRIVIRGKMTQKQGSVIFSLFRYERQPPISGRSACADRQMERGTILGVRIVLKSNKEGLL